MIMTNSGVGDFVPELKIIMGAWEGLLAAVNIADDEVDVGLDGEPDEESCNPCCAVMAKPGTGDTDELSGLSGSIVSKSEGVDIPGSVPIN